MAAFDLALSRVRDDSDHFLPPERTNQLARSSGHVFRDTKLNPGTTLRLFAQQIANGNIACSAMTHLAGFDFSDTAWCQARQRLPIELIQQVYREMIDDARCELNQTNDVGEGDYRWHGHRTFVVDGSTDSMSDTPELREHYGVPLPCRPGLGFPMSHLLLLMDHRSGLVIDCVDSPMYTSDMSQTAPMHGHLNKGDIIIADDAFAGWAHLALILQAHLHAVMPAQHRRRIDFTPNRPSANPRKGKSSKNVGKPRSRILQSVGTNDQIVEYPKPPTMPAWIDPQLWDSLPPSIKVREVRRTIKRNGFRPITVTIVTTLLDAELYPADELIDLRLSRWMIETNLRHLKITLGMDILKCKTLDGVRKERLMFLLVYNMIRRVMLVAARSQHVNVNRLSFADTLAWLRLGDITMISEIKINPLRPGRLEPRVRKRPKKQFPYMTIPRSQLKAQLRATHCDTA
jgi:Transposase DDE domain